MTVWPITKSPRIKQVSTAATVPDSVVRMISNMLTRTSLDFWKVGIYILIEEVVIKDITEKFFYAIVFYIADTPTFEHAINRMKIKIIHD